MKNRFLLMTACFACLFLLQSSVWFENLNNSDQTALSNALAEKLAKINFGTNKGNNCFVVTQLRFDCYNS